MVLCQLFKSIVHDGFFGSYLCTKTMLLDYVGIRFGYCACSSFMEVLTISVTALNVFDF